jgi:hypothetical protein
MRKGKSSWSSVGYNSFTHYTCNQPRHLFINYFWKRNFFKNLQKKTKTLKLFLNVIIIFLCFVSGLNHVLSICIGLSFSVDAISGDGVMGMTFFL